ncbi:MAG TPA: hypothetical protein VIP30_01815 [Stenotrophomonas sp.]
MLGITAFGMLHTVISLIGMGAGFVALFARFRIGRDTRAGRVFVLFTALSAITGLFIYHHGGFGKPHVLSLATLVVLALGVWFERRGMLRWQALRVASLLYTVALFFHFIPGLTETFTRLPVAAPLFDSPDDPQLAASVGVIALVFLVMGVVQWRHLRRLAGAVAAPLVVAPVAAPIE